MARKTKPRGYYTLENTISEAKKVIEENNLDKLITQNKLIELGYGGLNTAINRYHGGLLNFRKKHLGQQKELQKDLGYWYSLDNCLNEANKIMKEHELDTLPTQRKLTELGYSSLNTAILKYHGGFNNFRKKHFGEEPLQKPIKYWHSLENTIFESKKVMEEHNYDTLPSAIKLNNLGHSGLTNAIKRYHGGFLNFREIMNQELGIKSNKEHLTEVWKKYTGK